MSQFIIPRWGIVLASVVCIAAAEPSPPPIGLVLGGGGAKGAYQVGVWETLVEMGLSQRVHVLSGTSVGAINAALFATCSDTGRMERVWLESLPKVMAANKDRFGKVGTDIALDVEAAYRGAMARELSWRAELTGIPASEFTEEEIEAIAREVAKRNRNAPLLKTVERLTEEGRLLVASSKASEGLVDSAPLRSLLRENLPSHWPSNAPAAYATALVKDGENPKWPLVSWKLNIEPTERQEDMILASAAIPGVFPSVAIDGREHVDAGWEDRGGDNAPIGPIVRNHPEIKTVIVVYLNDPHHVVGRIRKESHPKLQIIEIFPSKDIGQWITGSLNFDADQARRLITLGREDARKILNNFYAQKVIP